MRTLQKLVMKVRAIGGFFAVSSYVKRKANEYADGLEDLVTNLKPFLKHKTECRINRVVNGECDCGLNDILGEEQ